MSADHSRDNMNRKMPVPLWVAVVALAVISALGLLTMLKRGSMPALFATVANGVLLLGLMAGRKWAYALTIVLSVLGVAVAFGKGVPHGLMVLIGNAAVLVPVLMSTKYFFPTEEQRVPTRES